MRISVFGLGYVGAVSSGCFAALGHSIVGVDVSAEKVAMLGRGISPIVEAEIGELIATAASEGRLRATDDAGAAVAETDISLISVGTPSAADGSVSWRAVDAVVAAIGAAIGRKDGAHAVVMRSTVPPGTAEERVVPALEAASGRRLGDGLSYYSNPEFLREGTAVRDFHAPPFTLLGAPDGDAATLLRELYAPVQAPLHMVPYRIAESVKYLSNAFHAVKLAFANEAGAILGSYGVDAPAAFRLFCEDRTLNISPAYLRPGFAFGGSCLPKDVRSFLSLAERRAVAAPLLGHVLASNTAIVERAFEAVARYGRQPVALFGLAFKQGTDDLRESPYVLLAERLLGRGWPLRIFDRSVNVAALLGANRAYIDHEIPHLERLMAVSPAAALSECRLAVIGHVAPEDRDALAAALRDHVVIDLGGGGFCMAAKGSRIRACAGEGTAVIRPRLLFVSPRFLFPLDEGGKIRTTGILRAMRGGAFEIVLASPAPPDAQAHAAAIAGVCDRFVSWPAPRPGRAARVLALAGALPVSVASDRSAAGAAVVARELAAGPALTVVDFPHAAVLLPPDLPGRSALFTHNVETEIFERHAQVARGPMRLVWRREAAKMRGFEATTLRRFDTVIAVSARDARVLRERFALPGVAVIDTGVDLHFYAFHAPEQTQETVVFSGAMDSRSNIDGIAFLLHQVWPLLAAARPQARMLVVGRNPPADLVARARGLPWTFTGFVDDIRPHVLAGDVSVIPLRVGSGTRLKAFEAMALGRPVVSTALGVEGLSVEPGTHFVAAETPAEFAAAIAGLLADAPERRRLAEAARALLEARFSWAQVGRQFEAICLRAAGVPAPA